MIGRDDILRMIPHGPEICLLDEVLAWDTQRIRCASRRFAGLENPLRRADGTLGAAACVEIAAQAMAVHGRLGAPGGAPPVRGYLVSLREVRLLQPLLDGAAGALEVATERLSGDARGAAYGFSIAQGGAVVLHGRATVVLEPG